MQNSQSKLSSNRILQLRVEDLFLGLSPKSNIYLLQNLSLSKLILGIHDN